MEIEEKVKAYYKRQIRDELAVEAYIDNFKWLWLLIIEGVFVACTIKLPNANIGLMVFVAGMIAGAVVFASLSFTNFYFRDKKKLFRKYGVD